MDIYDDGEGIVYAVADGEIVSTYNGCKHVNKSNDTCNGGYGNYIKIKHTDGTYSLYAHLKRGSLTSSKKVKAGDAIAKLEVPAVVAALICILKFSLRIIKRIMRLITTSLEKG